MESQGLAVLLSALHLLSKVHLYITRPTQRHYWLLNCKNQVFQGFFSCLRRMVLSQLQVRESGALERSRLCLLEVGGKKWDLHMQMYGIWKCHIATSTYK